MFALAREYGKVVEPEQDKQEKIKGLYEKVAEAKDMTKGDMSEINARHAVGTIIKNFG